MIKKVSIAIGNQLGMQLAYEKDQKEILAYGMQIVLETIIKLTIIAVLSIVLHIAFQTFLVLFVYSLFRTLGGGVHLSTYPRCLTIGTVIIVGCGAISTQQLDAFWFNIIFSFTVLCLIVCIIYWIPADTEKKRVVDIAVRNKQKIKVGVLTILWIISVIILGDKELHLYKQAVVYGALEASLLIIPAGYKLMTALDHGLDKLKKGGVFCEE